MKWKSGCKSSLIEQISTTNRLCFYLVPYLERGGLEELETEEIDERNSKKY